MNSVGRYTHPIVDNQLMCLTLTSSIEYAHATVFKPLFRTMNRATQCWLKRLTKEHHPALSIAGNESPLNNGTTKGSYHAFIYVCQAIIHNSYHAQVDENKDAHQIGTAHNRIDRSTTTKSK